MTSRWEKPGFGVIRVSGECTAYSGAEAVTPRPKSSVEPVDLRPDQGEDRSQVAAIVTASR